MFARIVFSVEHSDSIKEHLFHILSILKQFRAINPVTVFKSAQCSRPCWTWAVRTFQSNKRSFFFLVWFPRVQWVNSVCLCDKRPHNLFRKYFTSSKIFLFLFLNLPSGWLISLGDAAVFTLVCLPLCFQPNIKMPGSAGYHGASSLLSAHFNPADFSSRFFISVFSLQSFSLSVLPSWFHFWEKIKPS